MVFSVKTFNNINQIGLKELGNAFQIDGQVQEPIIFLSTRQRLRELWSLTLQELMPMR